MNLASIRILVTSSWAAVAALAAGVAPLAAAEPSTQELLDRINTLQNKVDTLERQEQDRSTAGQAATAAQVQADADAHSRFPGPDNLSLSYRDGKLRFQSDDGRFLFHPWLQLQFRETTSYREDAKNKGADDDTQTGFEVRRLKFGVDGNAFTPNLTYMFQFNIDRTNYGDILLELAWAKYHFEGAPFSIRAGQIKDPFDHEQIASSRTLPVSERSLVDDTFANAEGFVKGASLIYEPVDAFRSEVAITGGLGSANTNFQNLPSKSTPPVNWGAAARAEYKLFGKWSDYDVVSAYTAQTSTLVVGGGVDYTETGRSDSITHVADAQFTDRSGLSLYGAYLGRYTARGAHGDTYDATLRGQASYALDRHWEPFARYEYIHFDSSEFAATARDNVHVMTAGFNYYLAGPSARFTLDLSYLPNGSPVADTGAGILVNTHNEFVLRGQFQLLL